jgi:hypothetical protein
MLGATLCRTFGALQRRSRFTRPHGRAYSLPALRASTNGTGDTNALDFVINANLKDNYPVSRPGLSAGASRLDAGPNFSPAFCRLLEILHKPRRGGQRVAGGASPRV